MGVKSPTVTPCRRSLPDSDQVCATVLQNTWMRTRRSNDAIKLKCYAHNGSDASPSHVRKPSTGKVFQWPRGRPAGQPIQRAERPDRRSARLAQPPLGSEPVRRARGEITSEKTRGTKTKSKTRAGKHRDTILGDAQPLRPAEARAGSPVLRPQALSGALSSLAEELII